MNELATSRDFTVAVFVIQHDHVILHPHAKLGIWLPPGGHIDPGELPDEAAIREVLEETGIAVELMGERGIGVDYPGQPVQLVRPEGIQLESITGDHEHIDLIYFARPTGNAATLPILREDMAWVGQSDLPEATLTAEVRDWCNRALATARRW
ncbi:MAG: NUDIX domain-containing protein [Chloroflexota bacterium]|nr:NUDIX domain-containing protein [Chloroflexia bacterium]MDQ3444010.1 NUDIX domain-containing protein [Chloroflexota bacterium]